MVLSTSRNLPRRASICLLMLAVVFAGFNVSPALLPSAHAAYSVAGTILGLVVIAGIIYLISQDQRGVYYRYPYGQYHASGAHYRYQGPYAAQYRNYQGRFYGGPLPGEWDDDQGRMNWNDYHRGWVSRCASREDDQGRWGQQRQYDAWCRENVRFRGGRPDDQWRRYNPWDHGNAGDRER